MVVSCWLVLAEFSGYLLFFFVSLAVVASLITVLIAQQELMGRLTPGCTFLFLIQVEKNQLRIPDLARLTRYEKNSRSTVPVGLLPNMRDQKVDEDSNFAGQMTRRQIHRINVPFHRDVLRQDSLQTAFLQVLADDEGR